MKTRAAVAWKAGEPLTVETIDIEGPKAGEVLVEIKATGICHTDAYTLSGADPEGLFPAILGHEGAGIVREVGAGVTTLKVGDHVIPLYTPECRQCKTCLSRRSNLCTAIRATQGKGLMPDGTSRFRCDGDPVFHYMGCSTFANYTVLPEIALAKVREDAPFDKICYIGCGVTTGVGAVINTAKVWPGANVAVFGLGGIGLNVIQGARMTGSCAGLLQRLQRVILGLRPAGTGARVVVERDGNFAEGLTIDFDDRLAELAELVGELELRGADLVGRLRVRFLQDVLEDFLVLVGKFRPDMPQPATPGFISKRCRNCSTTRRKKECSSIDRRVYFEQSRRGPSLG